MLLLQKSHLTKTGGFLLTAIITFERMKKGLLAISLLMGVIASAQVEFSVGTGLTGLRNLSPQQKFWAVGQTLQTNFHFSPKQSAYAWLDYYTEGRFRNETTATAKSPMINPQQIPYTATGHLTYRHVSLGLKHYFRGAYNTDKDFNIYGLAGFGFLFAKVRNTSSTTIDTSLYNVQVWEGEGPLKKLTFDLGLGGEMPLGGNFFIYSDARAWLPASINESPYLFNQRNVPLAFMLSAGVRVLFGMSY